MSDALNLSPEEMALIQEHRRKSRKPDWQPRPLEEIAAAEKCLAFDKLYGMALSEYQELLEKGYSDEDWRAYHREAVIELLGEGVWDAFRMLRR